MRILLLGKDGQIGRALQRTLWPLGTVQAFGHADANLENLAALYTLLQQQAPDLIANAAAYTAVDQAETHAKTARLINTDAVAVLARYAKANNALLIHYSSAYVFDGHQSSPYDIEDLPNPQNIYGMTKLAGEVAILESACDALIFRTHGVFSRHGHNFVKTILRLAKARNSLGVVADQQGTPTSAELIADVTASAIRAYQQGQLNTGRYHLTAAGHTTWYALACHIVARAHQQGIPLTLNSADIFPITTQDYPLPAIRPQNARLNTSALTVPLKLQLPHWSVHVDRTIDQLVSLPDSA